MPSDRAVRLLELFARLVGVTTALAGIVLLPSVPVLGVVLSAVGLLIALRPATAGELLDLVVSLV